jgi:hypothetical protein
MREVLEELFVMLVLADGPVLLAIGIGWWWFSR